MRGQVYALFLAGAALSSVGESSARGAESDALIKSAMSAAPASVAKDATIVTFDDKMQMVTLRKGTNGFTCMPDNPDTPGNDPECDDKAGFEFAMAWMSHKPPEMKTVGFGYMLQGGSDASNSDPFAKEPKDGKWLTTGPHVMLFNPGALAQNYPRRAEDPDTSAPYVMWPGTPYEHLMIPVK
jgi:hypothetical protein